MKSNVPNAGAASAGAAAFLTHAVAHMCGSHVFTSLISVTFASIVFLLVYSTWTEQDCSSAAAEHSYASALDAASAASAATAASAASSSSRFLIPAYGLAGPVPWSALSARVRAEYTLGGQVPVKEYFLDDTKTAANANLKESWTGKAIQKMLEKAELMNRTRDFTMHNFCVYGSNTCSMFFEALAAHPVRGKSVLVIGSLTPWVEVMCLFHGAASVTTVDFNKPIIVGFDGIRTMSILELDAVTDVFDVAVSFSSLEHDGLGRYGDPMNPIGDLVRMHKIRGLVAPDGLLFLGVPNGPDGIFFNAHRIYGPIRFPLLIKGWKLLGTFGNDLNALYNGKPWNLDQPLHVLQLE